MLQYERASTVLSLGNIRQQYSVEENIHLSNHSMEFLLRVPELLSVEGRPPPDIQFFPCRYLFVTREEGVEQMRQNYDLQR